jgi:ribosome-associated translation inhibitor RaiA
MSNTRIPQGVVIEIQAVDMSINERLQRKIFKMLHKFKQYFNNISWADFYMRQSPGRANSPRTVKVRLGIPGQDLFASHSGSSWKRLMKRVEQKILQQLERRKAQTSR